MTIIRAILHDESVFTEPEEFNPERYLKDGKLDPSVRQPEVSAFGFGRRYSFSSMILLRPKLTSEHCKNLPRAIFE